MNSRQRLLRLVVLACAFAAIGLVPTVTAYEGQVAGQVIVAGPVATAACRAPADVVATVLESGTGDPIQGQTVLWELVRTQHADDSLSGTETRTNADGETTVQVLFGDAPGQRTVRATADDAQGDFVINCAAGLPDTATSAPESTPTSVLGSIIAATAVLLGFGFLGLQIRRR
jgi:hypothetical protein